MKLKITIKGPKVHNIGGKFFLMTSAYLNLVVAAFNARNTMKDEDQLVVVLTEGDAAAIEDFKNFKDIRNPPNPVCPPCLGISWINYASSPMRFAWQAYSKLLKK